MSFPKSGDSNYANAAASRMADCHGCLLEPWLLADQSARGGLYIRNHHRADDFRHLKYSGDPAYLRKYVVNATRYATLLEV